MIRSSAPLAGLRRVVSSRPPPIQGERCEMCAEPIGAEHQHVVNLESRGLMCTCRGCYLLFTAEDAELRYRAVPDRYLSFPDFTVDARQYDELEIPVGLAFLFRNSVLGRVVAFYPGPAGATESELPLAAWSRIVAANPQLDLLRPDVEALLIRSEPSAGRDDVLLPSRADRHLLRAGRPAPVAVARLRRRQRGAAGHGRVLRRGGRPSRPPAP